jgi:hypothetical protein
LSQQGIGALVIGALVAAGMMSLVAPARAQFWGDYDRSYGRQYQRYPDQRYQQQQQQQQRDYFSIPFFNGERPSRPSQQADYSKAPSARKFDTPPATTIVVIGDSLADWLGYGLDELYADQNDTAVVRKIRPTSGLIRYDSKNDALDWSQAAKEAIAGEKPNAIVVLLGLNDRISIRDRTPPPPAGPNPAGANQAGSGPTEAQSKPATAAAAPASGAPPAASGQTAPGKPNAEGEAPPVSEAQKPVPGSSYEFHTDQWAVLYAKRIDEMIAALKSRGVPVVWVGLPALRGTKSTGEMSYLDELYRERAEKAGIAYVDIWDGFVDDQGRYTLQGPDFEGQTRRLRTPDGVHFTKAGAMKLASYVDRELRRLLSNRAVPVMLPGPEANVPKPPVGLHPDVGPVVPLAASGSDGDGADLLGGSRPSALNADPVATKVLTRGDAIAAPHGRADDFSWPHPSGPAPVAAVPAAQSPSPPAAPAEAAPPAPSPKTSAKSSDAGDSKPDARPNVKADTRAADQTRPRRAPAISLDGPPPRPPAPVTGGF